MMTCLGRRLISKTYSWLSFLDSWNMWLTWTDKPLVMKLLCAPQLPPHLGIKYQWNFMQLHRNYPGDIIPSMWLPSKDSTSHLFIGHLTPYKPQIHMTCVLPPRSPHLFDAMLLATLVKGPTRSSNTMVKIIFSL